MSRKQTKRKTDKLIEERTRRLARPLESPSATGHEMTVLLFRLANELHALEASHVHEVLKYRAPVQIPGLPSHFLGLFSHQGELYAMADLSILLGFEPIVTNDASRIIIIKQKKNHIGFLVESVDQVCRVPSEEVLPSPPAVTGNLKSYILGTYRDAWVLLDAKKLLHSPELVVDHENKM